MPLIPMNDFNLKPIRYPWRCLDETGKLTGFLDSEEVWNAPVPVWKTKEFLEVAWIAWIKKEYNKDYKAVPWPITGEI